MKSIFLGCISPDIEGMSVQPFSAKVKSKDSPTLYRLKKLVKPTNEGSKPKNCKTRRQEQQQLNPKAKCFEPRPLPAFPTAVLIRTFEAPNPPVLDLAASPDKKEDDITKSEKITGILEKIEEKYRERGVYNKMYETSDGSQVIRIDVRSVRALEKIEEALQEVDCPPLVNIVSLSTRYSCKKNGKKKGFNLFLKFENDSQRTFARYILESYCYEEKLWVVKDIPPKVLRVASEEEEARAEESIAQQIAEIHLDTQGDIQQREA